MSTTAGDVQRYGPTTAQKPGVEREKPVLFMLRTCEKPMANRRDPDEGDEGDAGKRLLNQLVREPLEVTVRNGQPNVVIDLLRYAVTKGGGGANAGSGARVFELTDGRERRIILALRNGILGTGVTSLRALRDRGRGRRPAGHLALVPPGAARRERRHLRGRRGGRFRRRRHAGNRRVAARVPARSNPPRHRAVPVQAEGLGPGGRRLGNGSKNTIGPHRC